MKTLVHALMCVLAASAAAEQTLTFAINNYQVEGNTVLPDARIDSALAPFTGQARNFADVQHALETLEGMYRAAGYGALEVYLPEQELNQGVVVFKVIEPRVGKVKIEGNRFFDAGNIRNAIPALKEGTVPNTGALAENPHLANESPSRRLTATLEAAHNRKQVDVDVKVEDEKPWRVFASADNTGTSEGRARMSLGYQNTNLFDSDQVLMAQATTSPMQRDKVKIFGAGYKIPLYELGDSISVYGGYSSVNSGVLDNIFNVSGKGDVAGLRYARTLPSVQDYQQKLQWGYDWRKFDTIAGIESRYRVQPVSVTYQAQWQSPKWSYDFNASLSHNFSGGDLALHAERVDAADHYTIARYGGEVYVSLPGAWMIHTALNGQKTVDALPSGEQFGLGGANSVRGYQERALSDDSGMAVNLEGYTPELATMLGWQGASLRGLVFGDYGFVTRNDVQPGEAPRAELAGAGLGVRMSMGKTAVVKLDVASALKDGGGAKKGEVRVHVVATVSY